MFIFDRFFLILLKTYTAIIIKAVENTKVFSDTNAVFLIPCKAQYVIEVFMNNERALFIDSFDFSPNNILEKRKPKTNKTAL